MPQIPLINFNEKRAVYFPPGDLAKGMYTDRVRQVLSTSYTDKTATINDAIELWECAKIIKKYPTFFDSKELETLKASADEKCSIPYSTFNKSVSDATLNSTFEEVELQYIDQFWELLASSSAYAKISSEAFRTFLERHPEQLNAILKQKKLVTTFDDCLRNALIANPQFSAELIIGHFGMSQQTNYTLYLPKALTNNDIDNIIMCSLDLNEPNLNFMRTLVNWPETARQKYNPSPEILARVQMKANELNNAVAINNEICKLETEVIFSPEQKACRSVVVDNEERKEERKIIFGSEWFGTYTDPATILNNFIYIFDLIDPKTRLLLLPFHRHEKISFLETFIPHSKNSYPASIDFKYRNSLVLSIMIAYDQLLAAYGTRIEDAIGWFYNEYFESEFSCICQLKSGPLFN